MMTEQELNEFMQKVLQVFTEGSVTEVDFDEDSRRAYSAEDLQAVDRRYRECIANILSSAMQLSPAYLKIQNDNFDRIGNDYARPEHVYHELQILRSAINLLIYDDPGHEFIHYENLRYGFKLVDEKDEDLYGTHIYRGSNDNRYRAP